MYDQEILGPRYTNRRLLLASRFEHTNDIYYIPYIYASANIHEHLQLPQTRLDLDGIPLIAQDHLMTFPCLDSCDGQGLNFE